MDENVLQISVYNSASGKKHTLHVRKDRLAAFYEFVMRRRQVGEYKPEPPGMPGLSWSAMLGLDAIFERRPKSFPAEDILQWIADDLHPGAGAATSHEVEKALEKFSAVYPPDVSESA